jgi:hypothetical protein
MNKVANLAQVHTQYIPANQTTLMPEATLYYWRCFACEYGSDKCYSTLNATIKSAIRHNVKAHGEDWFRN